MTRTRLGYWKGKPEDTHDDDYLWPGDLIDPDWDAEEKALVVAHLRDNAFIETSWMGYSWCRLCDLTTNGTQCMTDGFYTFPEGYLHYVEEHNVKPPQDFIDHVRSYPDDLAEIIQAYHTNLTTLLVDYQDRVDNHTGCPDKNIKCHEAEHSKCRWSEGNLSVHGNSCHYWSEQRRVEIRAEQVRNWAVLSAAMTRHGATFTKPWYLDE